MTNPEQLQALRPRVEAAVQAWLAPPQEADFWMNWRGRGDGSDPQIPCVALVHYARALDCVADELLTEQLQSLAQYNDEEHQRLGRHRLPSETPYHWQRAQQLAALVQGLAAAVRAALAWVGNQPAEAVRAIGESAACYDRAWQLIALTVPASQGNGSDLFQTPTKSTLLLTHALNQQAFGARGVTISTWLILQRLLATLFREPLTDSRFENEIRLLFFAGQNRGTVHSLAIEARPGDQVGLIVDPLAFGVTILDPWMQQSLRRAFRCCRQSLLAQPGSATAQPTTLTLTGDLPLLTSTLSGDSAGGLIATGLYATARNQRLDRNRTATVALAFSTETEPHDDVPLSATAVSLVSVGAIETKLRAAGWRDEGLTHVALCSADHRRWTQRHPDAFVLPTTVGVDTLADLYETLRGDHRLEELLERHADEVAADWERIETADANSPMAWRDLKETLRFDCYVAPSYRIERSQPLEQTPHKDNGSESAESEPADADVPGAGDEALLRLLELLTSDRVWDGAPAWLREAQARGPRWLAVYDQAGAGKTVCSYRLQHVAASRAARRTLFGDRAPLVIRWEGQWPRDRDGERLLSVSAALEQALADSQGWDRHDPEFAQRAHQTVRYALHERRAVIILDGFDQFRPEDVAHVATLLKRSGQADADAACCRWVITSRVHTVDELRADLFDDRRFARVRIDPFKQSQQDEYFQKRKLPATGEPIGMRWLATLGLDPTSDDDERIQSVRDSMDELLRLPMTLWWIGELIETTPANKPLPQFHTLSELAHTVARKLLQRAREKNLPAIAEKLRAAHVPPLTLNEADQVQLLERVLTLIAFQLLLEENYNGRVDGPDLPEFEERCRQRFIRETNLALREAKRRDDDPDRIMTLEEQLKAERHHWRWALIVLQTIELNHRSVTEAYRPTRLAFRSRKMVEFHAAWYLAAFATDWDRSGNGVDGEQALPCAWRFNGVPQWKECWKLLIEMPRAGRQETVWPESLAVLFRPTSRQPQSMTDSADDEEPEQKWQQRPTELMFRAWQRLARERHPGLAPLLAEYRAQFDTLLLDADIPTARLAAQLVPEFVLRERVLDPARLAELLPAADEPAYVRCPSTGDMLTFWMGSAKDAPGADESEQPRHQVEVAAFWMAACTVTRAQYRLFDSHLEKNIAESFTRISPDDDCPVILTDWYDGFCLALWLGEAASLPTETEWEGAARAGKDGPEDVIGIPPYDATFTSNQVNHNGNYPLIEGQKSGYLQRTLPVRWNEDRRAEVGLAEAPAAYQPNQFGIWQAHGNVWEWCLSVYDSQLYRRRSAALTRVDVDDVVTDSVTASRVLRGGSWFRLARYCRSANRFDDDPVFRVDRIGLRLCWRLRSFSLESSSSGL